MNPSRRLFLSAPVALLAGCGAEFHGAQRRRAVSGVFRSAHLGRSIGWSVLWPVGHRIGDPIPVVVTLHGKGSDHVSAFRSLGLGDALDEVRAPFALASVDGGKDSYYHRRTDGTDAAAMISEEFLPLLARHGLRTGRLGLHGWSMGGYGALLLAGQDHVPVRAVAVSSPALFTSGDVTAPGAFDSARDFDRHDVFAHPEWFARIPLHVDCGRQDPFYPATRDFVSRLRPPAVTTFGAGRHTAAYWRGVAPAQFRFLAAHLA